MKRYDIAAYLWPSYHYEPRTERYWPEKDGEWYTVRRATPRFPGHDMPKIPLLGYQDEADPQVMTQQVELGQKYGVNTFIVDWYWYDGEPCFERQLNDALIPALEGSESKFYLMWANHDADTLWDMHTDDRRLIWKGAVNRDVFEPMMERVVNKYFKLKSYYCIEGKPVFSIFLPSNFVSGMGSLDEAKSAMQWLDSLLVEKGFPGIHLQFIVRNGNNSYDGASAAIKGISNQFIAEELGAHSGTYYQYADTGCCSGDHVAWAEKSIQRWEHDSEAYPMLFPHASVGWDNTQRYPSRGQEVVVQNSTPHTFEASLHRAKDYVDSHPAQPPLITINSWNEWTEGSYLLPDMRWSYAYLEAIRKVFMNITA